MLASENFEALKISEDWDSNEKKQYAEEPLLKENASRFVLFPIQYHDVRFDPRSLV